MIEKFLDFLLLVAFNGFFAIFIAAFFWIILVFIFPFVMIPVSIIGGDEIANYIEGISEYRIIYTVVFISMMIDDCGIPNIKTAFKKKAGKKSKEKGVKR